MTFAKRWRAHRRAGERADDDEARSRWRALVLGLALAALVAVIAASDTLHGMASDVIDALAPVIARHPIAGMALFVLLSGVSAMLLFFSSAALVPLAITAWGQGPTLALLWIGWVLGGLLTYAIGRAVGGKLARRLVPRKTIDRYRSRANAATPLWAVVLLQLGLPSEIPGYLLGTLRYDVRRYLVAIGIAEIPYALATVYLGQRFLERDVLPLGAAAIALALVGLLARTAHRRLRGRTGGAEASSPQT